MKVTDKTVKRKMRFAGHNIGQTGTPLSKLIFWEPTHGHPSKGRPAISYVNIIKSDAGVTGTDDADYVMATIYSLNDLLKSRS